MFYEAQLAFNEGGNDGFWRFQLRDKYGRWIKMGGSAMFEFRKPNDKNVYKAKGTFQGNIRRGASIIRVGEGEQLPPGDYEVDSRYIESIKAIINTTSAKPEIVDAPKSVNPDVEKQATEREMVAATVKDLEAGDIVQQSTEEALYGQINSVEHGDVESKINVTWSDGSNYDMTLPGDKKIKVWGAEPEGETVDAPSVVKREPSMWDGVPFGSDEIQDSGDTNYAINEPNPPEVTYHVAPRSAREDILNNGLDPKDETWNTGAGADGTYRDEHLWMKDDDGNEFAYEYRPVGVYMFPTLERAQEYAGGKDADIYEIDTAINDREIIRDPSSAVNWDFLEEHEKAYVTRYVDPSALKIVGESETVDASKGKPVERNKIVDSIEAADEVGSALASRFGVDYKDRMAASVFKSNLAKNLANAMAADGLPLDKIMDSTGFIKVYSDKPRGELNDESVFNKVPEEEAWGWGESIVTVDSLLNSPYNDDTVLDAASSYLNVLKFDNLGELKVTSVGLGYDIWDGKTLKEIQQLMSESSDDRYKGLAVIGTSAAADMVAQEAASRLVQVWANSSNDSNARSLAIQETAKELFGLDKASPWQTEEKLRLEIEADLESHGDVYKSLLSNQYKATQEFLAEQGIKEFIAYRGLWSPADKPLGIGDNVPVTMRPLSSFTTSLSTAEQFSVSYDNDFTDDADFNSYIIKTKINAEDVFSIPGLGFGCLGEQELVVLGRLNTVSMLKESGDKSIKDDLPPEPKTVDAPKGDSIWGDAAPNERDVVAAAYARLPEDMPVAEIAALDPDFATYPDSMKSDPASIKEVAIGAMQELVRRWNGSSIYDDSTKVLHEVAREHFGISGASPVELTEGSKALMKNKEAYAAVLDAMYGATQEMFANAGIEEITVYRGSKTDSSGVRPLSSWTTSEDTAKAFAGSDGDTREMTVPVSQILSTSMSGGLGAWNEKEVVLLGPSETVDAGNVEEAEPEVQPRERSINSLEAATELVKPLAERYSANLSNTDDASAAFKKGTATVITDKLMAEGILAENLAKASDLTHAQTNKNESADADDIFNKLEGISTTWSTTLNIPIITILNPGVDENTVMETPMKLNFIHIDEYMGLKIKQMAPGEGDDWTGKTLREIQDIFNNRGDGAFAIVGTPEAKRVIAEVGTSRLIGEWAATSNDESTTSLAIQETAKNIFNLSDTADWISQDLGMPELIKNKLNNHGEVYSAFLTAQYEATQAYLSEQGIKEFVLYRGFTSKEKVETGYTDAVLRPLSSFSTSKTVAEEFALPGSFDYAYVIDMTVPAEDILSMPGLGYGCFYENEVVVLGGKKSAFIEML